MAGKQQSQGTPSSISPCGSPASILNHQATQLPVQVPGHPDNLGPALVTCLALRGTASYHQGSILGIPDFIKVSPCLLNTYYEPALCYALKIHGTPGKIPTILQLMFRGKGNSAENNYTNK